MKLLENQKENRQIFRTRLSLSTIVKVFRQNDFFMFILLSGWIQLIKQKLSRITIVDKSF